MPFDSPSGVAFLGSDLLIANQSYFAGTTANQVILSLDTGELGAPVYVPPRAGLAPALPRPPHRRPARHRRRRHRSALGPRSRALERPGPPAPRPDLVRWRGAPGPAPATSYIF